MTAKKKLWAAVAITIIAVGFFAAYYLFPKDRDRNFLNSAGNGWSYIRGYFAGIGWAKADLEENRALILGIGSPGGPFDKETGLRTWEQDCSRDHGMDGVRDGYNRIVRLWVHLKGPPPYSRKQWEGMLFNLGEFFDRRARAEPPIPLIADGPPILSSDGVTKVFLKIRRSDRYVITWEAGKTSRFWSPLSNAGSVEFSTSPLSPRDGVLLYLPGPPGSDLLLLRGRAGNSQKEMTAAFDMRYGFYLMYEPARWFPYFPGDRNYTK